MLIIVNFCALFSYYASEYGQVSGAENMKKELYKRGPIACTIDVTLKFEHYQGTVFENYSKSLFFIKSKTMNDSPFF